MYWKQGFYDETVEGSLEITDEYWRELLTGQENGLEIHEDSNGYPMLRQHVYTLEEAVQMKEIEINAYDSSDKVNCFILDGESGWLNKADRAGLINSINIEKDAGRTETKIWFNNKKHPLPVDFALDMIKKIELYAIDCNDTTEEHLAIIKEFATVQQVQTFDVTKDYPEILTFKSKKDEESIL